MIKNISVAMRLILGFGIVIVLLIICVLVALNGVSIVQSKLDKIITINNVRSGIAYSLIESSQDMRVKYRSILLVDDQDKRQLQADAYYDAKRKVNEIFDKIKDLNEKFPNDTSARENEIFNDLNSWKATGMVEFDKAISLSLARKDEEAKAQIFNVASPAMDKLSSLVRSYADEQASLQKNNGRLANAAASDMRSLLFMMSVIAILIAILLGWLIVRSINKTLGGDPHYVAAIMNELAQGNVSVAVSLRQGDQTSLAYAISKMIERLRTIIIDVKNNADNLSAASQQLSATSVSLSQASSESAASIEQTSSSIEEMSSSINQTNDNSKITENIATKASREATEGGAAVSETVKAMRQIAEKIKIIDDIAYKTNLLALNAAIEAARAGDHGKGFAVVAAEVRKLAERSQVAAQEIGAVASNSVALTERAGNLLEEIVRSSSKTAQLVQEIAAAANEQASGVSQINAAVQQINSSTQQNASSSEELASTAEEVSSQAFSLQEAMSFFKLESRGSRATSNQLNSRGAYMQYKHKRNNEAPNEVDFERF